MLQSEIPILYSKRRLPRKKDMYSEDNPNTSNLSTHIREAHPDKKREQDENPTSFSTLDTDIRDAIDSASVGSQGILRQWLDNYEKNPSWPNTQQSLNILFSAWVIDANLVFTTGQSPLLRIIFRFINSMFTLPSDTTVRKMVSEIFRKLHGVVVRELTVGIPSYFRYMGPTDHLSHMQGLKGRISYAHDTWTTRQMTHSYSGVVAFFIDDDWKLVQRMVDFKVLDQNDHQGAYAAISFVNSAASRGGLDKFLSLAMDNASVNEVLMRGLSHLLQKRYGLTGITVDDSFSRCLAHATNLAVQAALAALGEAEDPESYDYYLELHRKDPIHYNEEMAEEDARVAEEEGEDEGEDANAGGEEAEDMEDQLQDLVRVLDRQESRSSISSIAKTTLKKVFSLYMKVYSADCTSSAPPYYQVHSMFAKASSAVPRDCD